MSDLVNIPYGSLTGYELERMKMTLEVATKIFINPRFRKYRDWFMFDEVSPESGQIAPALAHFGLGNLDSHHSDQKTG
ncbi:transcriptional regulator [Aeromonas salmonicida]|uniref:transcriptional regulator n=1 Tax=Aeromonas salmonicida TaxID=645 RepID=UPI002330D30E|nr:transcriptional regulator [Aeromonas salmonicida]WCH37113.1 transcriptional regulator [Aeromonas salmonicida]WGI37813.1 transcriptional regulator [Aeromonas salmonicida]